MPQYEHWVLKDVLVRALVFENIPVQALDFDNAPVQALDFERCTSTSTGFLKTHLHELWLFRLRVGKGGQHFQDIWKSKRE